MDRKEWKNIRREAMKEWKERMKEWRDIMDEWRKRIKEWKVQAKSKIAEGYLPPMPPLPPLPSIPSPSIPSVSRANVVASRIGDEALRVIDMLIEAGLFSTRSEAVAHLVSEGIKAQKDILDKVSSALEEIRRIRKEAEEHITKLKREIGFMKPEALEESEQQKRICPECSRDLTDLPEDISICPYCGFQLKNE